MKKLLLLLTFICHVFFTQAQWLPQTTVVPNQALYQISPVPINANEIWAAAYSYIPAENLILKTADGGTTWTTFPLASTLPNGYSSGDFTAINASTAWFTAVKASSQILLFKTTNGGQNWSQQISPFNSGETAGFVHFFNTNDGVAFGNTAAMASSRYHCYTTSNGGTTWTKVPATNMPAPMGWDDEGFTAHTTLGNTIWVSVRAWRVYKSTDKGLTWTASATTMSGYSTPFFMNLAFTDAANGLARYQGRSLAKTTDGGATWSAITYAGKLHQNQLRAIPGSPGVYISAGSYYYSWGGIIDDRGSSFTFDHGNTWVSLGDTIPHTDVTFLNSTTGWTGGKDGTIHKFTGSPLGISKTTLAATGFTISPNPGTGIFTLSGNIRHTSTVEVYNLVGNKVLQQKTKPFVPTSLNLTSQPKGIYLVKILDNNQTLTKKIILQ